MAHCFQVCAGLDQVDCHCEVSFLSCTVQGRETFIQCYRYVGPPVQQDPDNERVTLLGGEYEGGRAYWVTLVDVDQPCESRAIVPSTEPWMAAACRSFIAPQGSCSWGVSSSESREMAAMHDHRECSGVKQEHENARDLPAEPPLFRRLGQGRPCTLHWLKAPPAYDVRRREQSAGYHRARKDMSRASHVRRELR